jgi:hypothetical protein
LPLRRARSKLLRASSLYRTSDYGLLLCKIPVAGPNQLSKQKENTIFGEEDGVFFWLGVCSGNQTFVGMKSLDCITVLLLNLWRSLQFSQGFLVLNLSGHCICLCSGYLSIFEVAG